MNAFTRHRGIVAPLEASNVDTDQIIPKQFLKRITRTGYDDALFFLAQFNENNGGFERQPDGSWQMKPDYVAAVELYRKLLAEFRKGETRYYDDAKNRVQAIVDPTLNISVERFFLPGSEVGFTLGWRNLAKVDLALHPVDLTRDLAFAKRGASEWLASIELSGKEPVQRWTHATKDSGEHQPGSAQLALEKKPEPGAYVLVARGDGQTARALVLVGDAAVTVKVSGTKLLAWATDVERGAPIAEARVKLYEHWHDGNEWRWKEKEQRAGVDGVATFELEVALLGAFEEGEVVPGCAVVDGGGI